MAPTFCIPERLDELSKSWEPSEPPDRLLCQNLIPIEDLTEELVKEVTYELSEREVVSIEDQDLFDQVYSLVRGFALLDPLSKSRLLESLCSNLSVLIASIAPILASGSESPLEAESRRQSIYSIRNALKIYVYFIHQILTPEDVDVVLRKERPAKGKGRKSRQKHVPQQWDREALQTRFIRVLAAAALSNLQQLFGTAQLEEGFVRLIAEAAFTMLESPTAVKDKDLKDALCNIGSVCATKYGYLEQSVACVMDLLHKFDHLHVHLAELVAVSKESFGDTTFASTVLREIGRTNPKEYARDTKGAEKIGLFLVELTARLPKVMCTNLSFLMHHMDGEAYKMRNALVQVMGILVAKAFGDPNGNGSTEPSSSRTRQVLLDKLLERTRDVNAYTRTKTLQTWARLCQDGAISIGHWNLVASIAAGRLEDKSAFVRKSALELLATLLQFNPFGPKLRSAAFEATLEKYKKQLEEMSVPASSESSDVDETLTPAAPSIMHPTEGAASQTSDASEQDTVRASDDGMAENNTQGTATSPGLSPETTATEMKGTPRLDVGGLEQTRALVASLEAGLHFSKCMASTLPVLAQLLASKTVTDVDQTIQLLMCCKQFQVDGSEEKIRKILPLVFSQEQGIREAVEDAFHLLYIKKSPSETAANLINLTLEANLGDLASIEALVSKFMEKGEILQSTVSRLWDIFRFNAIGVTADQSRGALVILTMAAKTCPKVLSSNMQSMLDIGFGRRAKEDVLLSRFACIGLQRLSDEDRVKLGRSHKAFNLLSSVIIKGGLSDVIWYSVAEQAINAIYVLHPMPETFLANLLVSFSQSVFSGYANGSVSPCNSEQGESADPGLGFTPLPPDSCMSASAMGRFFFIVAHVALKQLVYVETCVRVLRKQKAQKEREESSMTEESIDGSTLLQKSSITEELGLVATEDARLDDLLENAETEIVSGGNEQKTLISIIAPLVAKLCRKYARLQQHPELRSASMLALCKLMAVDAQFCDQNLQLLVTVARTSTEESLRSNCVIALGDLSMRFPNLVEPWTEHVYSCLHDSSAVVRKNAVLVLAHLILNDMMKVKGHVTELALHFEDEDQRVASLVKLFFHELSKKGSNPIYSLLPDMISRMSSMANLPQEQFRSTLQFLISFIEKDKQTEGLVEKLCNRFPGTSDAKQWRDIAYCLSELKCTEKGMKKLMDMFKTYELAVLDEEVVQLLEAMVAKAAKKAGNAELKLLYDEFREKIGMCHKEQAEREHAFQSANLHGINSGQIHDSDMMNQSGDERDPSHVLQNGTQEDTNEYSGRRAKEADEEHARPPNTCDLSDNDGEAHHCPVASTVEENASSESAEGQFGNKAELPIEGSPVTASRSQELERIQARSTKIAAGVSAEDVEELGAVSTAEGRSDDEGELEEAANTQEQSKLSTEEAHSSCSESTITLEQEALSTDSETFSLNENSRYNPVDKAPTPIRTASAAKKSGGRLQQRWAVDQLEPFLINKVLSNIYADIGVPAYSPTGLDVYHNLSV